MKRMTRGAGARIGRPICACSTRWTAATGTEPRGRVSSCLRPATWHRRRAGAGLAACAADGSTRVAAPLARTPLPEIATFLAHEARKHHHVYLGDRKSVV